jgi:hypothetical protein
MNEVFGEKQRVKAWRGDKKGASPKDLLPVEDQSAPGSGGTGAGFDEDGRATASADHVEHVEQDDDGNRHADEPQDDAFHC